MYSPCHFLRVKDATEHFCCREYSTVSEHGGERCNIYERTGLVHRMPPAFGTTALSVSIASLAHYSPAVCMKFPHLFRFPTDNGKSFFTYSLVIILIFRIRDRISSVCTRVVSVVCHAKTGCSCRIVNEWEILLKARPNTTIYKLRVENTKTSGCEPFHNVIISRNCWMSGGEKRAQRCESY